MFILNQKGHQYGVGPRWKDKNHVHSSYALNSSWNNMSQHQPLTRTLNIFYVQYVSTSYLAFKLFFSFNICKNLTTNLVQHTLIINHEFKFSKHLETSLTHHIVSSFSYHSTWISFHKFHYTLPLMISHCKKQKHNVIMKRWTNFILRQWRQKINWLELKILGNVKRSHGDCTFQQDKDRLSSFENVISMRLDDGILVAPKP